MSTSPQRAGASHRDDAAPGRQSHLTFGGAVDDEDTERSSFDFAYDEEVVPGVMWRRKGLHGPAPLVLLGHGRTRDKPVPYVATVGQRVGGSGEAVAVSFDAPGHGGRLPLLSEWDENVAVVAAKEASMVADALEESGVATGPRAFWGLSMGALVGLYWAAGDPKAAALAIGLLGLSDRVPPQRGVAAAEVRCPTLFHVQLDDPAVGVARARAMYDAIAAGDKRLSQAPGDHWSVPDAVRHDMVGFLLARLGSR